MTKFGMVALLSLVIGYLALFALVVEQVKTSTAGLVALFVLLMLPIVGVAVGLFWLHARAPRAKPQREEHPVDTTWRELGPAQGYYPEPQLGPPAVLPKVNRVTVPIQYQHGSNSRAQQTVLTSVAEDEHGERVELECSLPVLQVAAQILQDGKQPVRSEFNSRGVMSSSEVTACTSFLRAHGWLRPIPTGSTNTPARWVEGASAEQLQQFISTWSTTR